ncbi:uncharacterized protein LOC132201827 [Neocloeon triangulifer]|uniref:uncharacterized protein LOC132201827 n=1 Tax=Neocloeon triangulifer TaxID=2078957 RepID=UPI00286EC675|nr:uncharacterized protein LOC132201827 [Neocloeon triangulifer]
MDQLPIKNSSVYQVLERASKEDCDILALFIFNGRKLAHILRTADKRRLVKSKLFFILPFDLRLFAPKMHNFWRRLVNVIYIRDSRQVPLKRENYFHNFHEAEIDANRALQCFELSTVSFPTPVDPDHPESWLPRPTATRCNERFSLNGKRLARILFEKKTQNLNGEILRVSYLELAPSVIKSEHGEEEHFNNKIHGVEIEEASNLTTGALQSLMSGTSDIVLGSFPDLPSFGIDLSAPYATYCYTFLTPELIGDVSWKTLILPFGSVIWALAATALIVGWLSMHLIARLQGEKCEMANLVPSAFSALGMQLLVPLPREPKGWPLRLLFCCFWLHCLLLSVSYRASFASQLAKPPPRIALDTVEKLAEAKYLRLITYDTFAKDMFNSTPDEHSRLIAERLQEVDLEVQEIVQEIKMGKAAFFGNAQFLGSIKTFAEKTHSGKYSVHLNEECIVSLPMSLGLARNSALTSQVDKIVRRTVENGLVTKWLQESNFKSVPAAEAQQALVDLAKMVSVFAALGAGLFISSIVCLIEIVIFRYGRRK